MNEPVRPHFKMRGWGRATIATRLVLGFWVLIFFTLLLLLGSIGILMQQRLHVSADSHLVHHALIVASKLQDDEAYLAREARYLASMRELGAAIELKDTARLESLFSSLLDSHRLSACYVIDADRHVLFSIGDPITAESTLVRLLLVEKGFDGKSESAPLAFDTSIWLAGAAPYHSADGKTDAVILLTRRVDQSYLQTFSNLLDGHYAMIW